MGSAECDFEVRAFEDVCDVGGFLADICETSPFSCSVVRCLFVSVGCLGSVWFYCEGVVQDVMYYVEFLLVFLLF